MNVIQYNQSNGKPWGFFVYGHYDANEVIDAFNYHIQERGYLAVTSDYVSQVYAAEIVGLENQSHFNVHVFDEDIKGSSKITWVDGNLLEPAQSAYQTNHDD
ncbi:hypothetical protein OH460_08375 [Vibrio sp. Makdt]|uniref:hypothetical protein n=1 Tax=Vibrio sp. Makdt TaxID=2998828 RepID=UPI0022CD2F09|nr:hypothetical protein [Vibrio sp. Makdt]MDA0152315.1 hypothetical protein [Vibrio sp. Makdt]